MRSERFAAILLVAAAALGLTLANSPLSGAAHAVESFHLAIPLLGLDLSVGHWVKDGLLAIFFFLAAIELKHELQHGELNSPRKALIPAIAAVGGVVVPALVYLLIVIGNPDLVAGWPIPTATDIAFALGVLAIVGRGLPPAFRALLLALAVIDDLIAILIIAVFFTDDLRPIPLLIAVPVVLLFGWVSYRSRGRQRAWAIPALIVLGIAAWVLVYHSGIHPTIAGVALGIVMAGGTGARARHGLEPWSNVIVLPLFAIVASLVPIPTGSPAQLSPAFWAVLVALPVGKIVGITAGALVAGRLSGRRGRSEQLPLPDIVAIAALGGIGFTVSLLMNELAFEDLGTVADQVTLAVIIASIIAAIVGGVLTALRARAYRAMTPA